MEGEINTSHPDYVLERTMNLLNEKRKTLNDSKVILLGAADKKTIDNIRKSPSLELIEILRERCAEVDYSETYILVLLKTSKFKFDMNTAELTK